MSREMRIRSAIAIAGALAVLTVAAVPAGAATLQPVGEFSSPVYVTSDPDDAARLFVVERGGAIRLIANGTTTTFLDVATLAVSGGERGLLSMAFAPDFASSGRFFVYYTSRPNGDIQIDEFTAQGDRSDIATRRPILTIPHGDAGNHNGGQLQFGPDGFLYLATGDGGGGGDAFHNAQDTDSLLGKVLRIDPLRPTANAPYTVPADNPFVGRAGADEIWSTGLRNPYRFSFDRQTGALLIGDVGQSTREEINYEPQPNAGRGDNFGWSCREGLVAFATTDPLCVGASGFTDPIHDYPRSSGCSVTGGYVARDPSLGDLVGRYVYADYCQGEIRSLVPSLPAATGDRSEGINVSSPSSFGEDACGHLYVVSLNGTVSRFVGDSPSPCTTGGDTTAPSLEADARKRQSIDRKIKLEVGSAEAATVTARLEVVAGGKTVAKPKKKTAGVPAGGTAKISWKLDRSDRRAAHKATGKLTARFTARAEDASGNQGKKIKASSKLSG